MATEQNTQTGKIGVTTENIFPVIKKFLYSDHEIFLRELVANAVDATQKMKALAASGEFKGELGDLKVSIVLDEAAKTLKIIDEGIGMTAEEVDKYINQIAFSSAGEFLEKYKDQISSIIGHFGLGFYSAFMVADEVHIDTLSYKEGSSPVHWESDGESEYTIEEEWNDCDNGKSGSTDENNIVQQIGQVINGWFSRTNTRNESTLLFHIIRNFQRIESNGCIEICEENYHHNVENQTD